MFVISLTIHSYSGTALCNKETKSDLKRQTPVFNAVKELQQNHLFAYALWAIITVASDRNLSFMEQTGLEKQLIGGGLEYRASRKTMKHYLQAPIIVFINRSLGF